MIDVLTLEYPGILNHIEPYKLGSRTESSAFLVWFLQHVYRLDDVESDDAVCDGPGDKGIDGIYVYDNLDRIDVFQSRLVTTAKGKTLGDAQLKEFVGSLAQFGSPDRVRDVASTTSNHELKKLLTSNDIAKKIEDGYMVRGVFVTNAPRDCNAETYLSYQANLVLFDRESIMSSYVPDARTILGSTPISFDVYGYDSLELNAGGTRVIIAPLSATQLVKLDGLASGALFAWNVRQSLGRTKVNKEITKSIQDPVEHGKFLLYHNGITMLCSSIKRDEDTITISEYSVVNGCQSLTSLYENQRVVSDDLRILVRLIEISPTDPLADKITHHSNNQNPISARDLQSNSLLQRRLQTEFNSAYGDRFFYSIKRGERADERVEVIDNEEAARVMLAFDLKEPWTCHQTYKLFDELHSRIFARPEVTANRIYVFYSLYTLVTEVLQDLEIGLMARYRLTRYFLLYLLRLALERDPVGRDFCVRPESYLHSTDGEARIRKCAEKVLSDIIIDLREELKERQDQGDTIDYKRELKSSAAVREMEKPIMTQYEKAARRGRASFFGEEWRASA